VTSNATASDTITEMLDVAARMGRDVLTALRSDRPATESMRVVRSGAASFQLPSLPKSLVPTMRDCGCDIPAPCWMPRDLGEVVSHGCPGATAKVRLRITNCGLGARSITAEARGSGGAKVTWDTQTLVLDTFEQGTVAASLAIPAEGDASVGALLWVRGCHDHVLRWRVEVTGSGCSSLHEVDVQDCPDLVHHWYDHFYCARPCTHAGKDDPKHG
jgi:hypothetical protein